MSRQPTATAFRVRLRRSLTTAGIVVISIFVSLLVLEWGSYLLASPDDVARYPSRPQPNVMQPNALHSFGHILENLDYVGPQPWEPSSKRLPRDRYHIRSSRFGFFTDHPVDEFPAKIPGEFRILLMGGSGAQGHGAQTNDDMFYKKLEVALTDRLRDVVPRVRIINLAQAGAYAFINARILNLYGHGLGADMILGYNGPNELSLPYSNKFITSCNYGGWMMAMTFEYPPFLHPMAAIFPRLFNVYGLGNWLKRTFYSDYYNKRGQHECVRQFGGLSKDGSIKTGLEFYQWAVRPYFSRPMKSIKRDFCGAPVILIRQAIHPGENKIYESWYGEGIYDRWWRDAKADLAGYMNGGWYFYDFHKESHERDNSDIPGFVSESLAIHLDNPGHLLAARLIGEFIEPIVRSYVGSSTRPGQNFCRD